jgi:hypothetical protein
LRKTSSSKFFGLKKIIYASTIPGAEYLAFIYVAELKLNSWL